MTDLSNLKPAPGATADRKRKGRGPGSNLGKTAGRGQKGQKSRSGGSISPAFEGGQMPLQRRLPKFGFSNAKFRKHFSIVNLHELEERFEDGATVDEEALRAIGLVKGQNDGVKILANGELTKKLNVKAQKFSKSARAAIEEAGGSAEVI